MQWIHHRYEDTSLVIFRQQQKKSKDTALSFPGFQQSPTSSASASKYSAGPAVLVTKSGNNETKSSEKQIHSSLCVIL